MSKYAESVVPDAMPVAELALMVGAVAFNAIPWLCLWHGWRRRRQLEDGRRSA